MQQANSGYKTFALRGRFSSHHKNMAKSNKQLNIHARCFISYWNQEARKLNTYDQVRKNNDQSRTVTAIKQHTIPILQTSVSPSKRFREDCMFCLVEIAPILVIYKLHFFKIFIDFQQFWFQNFCSIKTLPVCSRKKNCWLKHRISDLLKFAEFNIISEFTWTSYDYQTSTDIKHRLTSG